MLCPPHKKACTDPSLVRRSSVYASRKWCSIADRQDWVGVVPTLLPPFYERPILRPEHCASSATPCQLPNVRVALWRLSSLTVLRARLSTEVAARAVAYALVCG